MERLFELLWENLAAVTGALIGGGWRRQDAVQSWLCGDDVDPGAVTAKMDFTPTRLGTWCLMFCQTLLWVSGGHCDVFS